MAQSLPILSTLTNRLTSGRGRGLSLCGSLENQVTSDSCLRPTARPLIVGAIPIQRPPLIAITSRNRVAAIRKCSWPAVEKGGRRKREGAMKKMNRVMPFSLNATASWRRIPTIPTERIGCVTEAFHQHDAPSISPLRDALRPECCAAHPADLKIKLNLLPMVVMTVRQ